MRRPVSLVPTRSIAVPSTCSCPIVWKSMMGTGICGIWTRARPSSSSMAPCSSCHSSSQRTTTRGCDMPTPQGRGVPRAPRSRRHSFPPALGSASSPRSLSRAPATRDVRRCGIRERGRRDGHAATVGAPHMDERILDLYSMLVVGLVCAGLLLSLGALWRSLHHSLSASSSTRKPPLRTRPHTASPAARPPTAILGRLAGLGAAPASLVCGPLQQEPAPQQYPHDESGQQDACPCLFLSLRPRPLLLAAGCQTPARSHLRARSGQPSRRAPA